MPTSTVTRRRRHVDAAETVDEALRSARSASSTSRMIRAMVLSSADLVTRTRSAASELMEPAKTGHRVPSSFGVHSPVTTRHASSTPEVPSITCHLPDLVSRAHQNDLVHLQLVGWYHRVRLPISGIAVFGTRRASARIPVAGLVRRNTFENLPDGEEEDDERRFLGGVDDERRRWRRLSSASRS